MIASQFERKTKTREERIQQYLDHRFKDPGFRALHISTDIQRFKMGDIKLTFCPGEIIISGDYFVRGGTNGLISDSGYHLLWFLDVLPSDYLCSKFMRTEYDPDDIVLKLYDVLSEPEEHELTQEQVEDIQQAIRYQEGGDDRGYLCNGENAYDFLDHIMGPDWCMDMLCGYPVEAAALLGAIQESFKHRYGKWKAEQGNIFELPICPYCDQTEEDYFEHDSGQREIAQPHECPKCGKNYELTSFEQYTFYSKPYPEVVQ